MGFGMEELAESGDFCFIPAEGVADRGVPEFADLALTVAELRDGHAAGCVPAIGERRADVGVGEIRDRKCVEHGGVVLRKVQLEAGVRMSSSRPTVELRNTAAPLDCSMVRPVIGIQP